MGCVTATAKRRRRQAKGGWKNLRPNDRPTYCVRTPDAAARHEARLRDRQNAMRSRSKKTKG